MNINVTKENGNTEITLDGRLDSTTAAAFDEVLQKEVALSPDKLTVNFARVDFISSIGLRVLVSGYRALGGREFIIKEPNSSVREILKMSGLLSVFTVE